MRFESLAAFIWLGFNFFAPVLILDVLLLLKLIRFHGLWGDVNLVMMKRHFGKRMGTLFGSASYYGIKCCGSDSPINVAAFFVQTAIQELLERKMLRNIIGN